MSFESAGNDSPTPSEIIRKYINPVLNELYVKGAYIGADLPQAAGDEAGRKLFIGSTDSQDSWDVMLGDSNLMLTRVSSDEFLLDEINSNGEKIANIEGEKKSEILSLVFDAIQRTKPKKTNSLPISKLGGAIIHRLPHRI